MGRSSGRRPRPSRRKTVAGAILETPTDETSLDPETGAVTSRQGADILVPTGAIEGLWDPEHLERAARTYWSSLQRFSLGLMHVHYTEAERSIVLLFPQLRLLTFRAPEYELEPCRGSSAGASTAACSSPVAAATATATWSSTSPATTIPRATGSASTSSSRWRTTTRR